jgi:succinate dehydrogenase (ubiquinone) cytochrome b560 subunit
MSPADSMQILVEQRKKRPTSPHLSIYEPQIPWILSILNRITGCILSGTFYIFGSAYLVAPLMGWNLSSVSIAAAFGSWYVDNWNTLRGGSYGYANVLSRPVIAKVITKLFFALPFTFHSFNGIRHLVWDMGKAFKNNTVIKSGWTLVGLSVTSALGLALFL